MSVHRYLHFKGLKQRDFAAALGITQGHFSEMVNGWKPISLYQAYLLSEMIGADLGDVVRAFLRVQGKIEGE